MHGTVHDNTNEITDFHQNSKNSYQGSVAWLLIKTKNDKKNQILTEKDSINSLKINLTSIETTEKVLSKVQ